MYWLSKPPYLRRTMGILIFLLALGWEFRPVPTEDRPFLAETVAAGEEIEPGLIHWRPVPVGVLPEFDAPFGIFLVDVDRGTPLTPSVLGAEPPVPVGWWGVDVPIPEGTVAGTDVRLVVDVRASPRVIPGIVIRLLDSDSLDGNTALVAIPEDEVGAAAAALADGSLRTLVGSR